MRRLWLPILLIAVACTDESTAPGICPNFCPGGQIAIHDTVFTTIIDRDSSFRGYVNPWQATLMTVADSPGVIDSRAYFVSGTQATRTVAKTGDTTTVPLLVDSVRVRVTVMTRDKQAGNLRLKFYQLPITADSTSDFASLDSYFSGTPLDSVNISRLLATPPSTDTAVIRFWQSVCATCIDTVRVDSVGNVLQFLPDTTLYIYVRLDSSQAHLNPADSGRVAFGIRVAADSFASVGLSTMETASGAGSQVHWYYHYVKPDTGGTTKDTAIDRAVGPTFDNFVFNPPSAAIDSNLTVGGVPSARSLLRVKMPAFLHDSIDIVRATLTLVPVAPIPGVPSDSFALEGRPVLTDIGAKSPLSTQSTLFGRTFIHPGSADTVKLELTPLVQAWSLDTTLVTTILLRQLPEAGTYTQARFYSSRTPAFRPMLHVTYVHRFQFGSL
jgi:hypothetical protein